MVPVFQTRKGQFGMAGGINTGQIFILVLRDQQQ